MNRTESGTAPAARSLRGVAILLLILAALALTAFLLIISLRYLHPADEILFGEEDVRDRTEDLSGRADRFSAQLAADSLSELTEIEIIQPEPAEEVPEEPKGYVIDKKALAGEIPNPACYGESADPDEVEAVIAAAADLLGGEKTVWNRDLPFWEGSVTRWYRDETILVLSWTELTGGALCYNSEVKIADASQFRRGLAGNKYGAGQQLLCSNMAAAANAVLASNADFYAYRVSGINVFRGKLYRCYPGLENCFIDGKGDLLVTHAEELTTEEETLDYIRENDVNFSISFGPILVENGEPAEPCYYYPVGQPTDVSARAVLAQMGELHYLIMNVNYSTLANLLTIVTDKEPIVAYTMDGGQTGESILGGTILNEIVFHAERTVSDIIYFATAVPSEEEVLP